MTIVIGLAILLIMGLLPIALGRLPNDRNPDSERWPDSGTRLIGAWASITIAPAIVLLGLARLL